MTKQVAVPVPGILTFRPRTYFGPTPAETHLLAHVTGHERREFLRAQLAADGEDPMLDTWASWLIQSGASEQFVQELGGWLSPKLVQRYATLRVEHLAPTAALIDRAVLPI